MPDTLTYPVIVSDWKTIAVYMACNAVATSVVAHPLYERSQPSQGDHLCLGMSGPVRKTTIVIHSLVRVVG